MSSVERTVYCEDKDNNVGCNSEGFEIKLGGGDFFWLAQMFAPNIFFFLQDFFFFQIVKSVGNTSLPRPKKRSLL